MLFFRSEEQVDTWCRITGRPHGEILTLAHVWRLSQAWYGNRISPDFRGRSTAEVIDLFRSQGLAAPFWDI